MPLPDETIAWLRQAARLGQAGALADLDAIARLDALEARVALLEATQHAHIEGSLEEFSALISSEPASIQRLEPMEPAAAADDDEPQTLHSVALDMVETLPILPEIRHTLRRAIREPMELAAAAASSPMQRQGFDHIADLSNMVPAAPAAPAAAAAPVATDDDLWWIWRDTDGSTKKSLTATLRAIYDHGRAHGTPPAVVEVLQEAEAALSGAALASSQALNALPAIRAALQLLGQPAPAAAPGPIELQTEARPEVVGFMPDEDAAPAEGLVTDVEACLVDQIRRHAPMAISTAEAILYVVAAWLDRRGQHGCSLWLREQCAISKEERGANG